MANPSVSKNIPESSQEEKKPESTHLESVARIMNFPVVKQTTELLALVYTKIKDNNSATKRTLTSAESIVKNAVNTATPLVATFQKPIEKVDNLLCTGLDYVENKLPVLKKDPAQMRMQDLLSYVYESQPVKTLRSIPEYSKEKIMNNTLVSKAQKALSAVKQFFTLNSYTQKLSIYEFITKKIKEIYPSATVEEVAEKDDESKEAAKGEAPEKPVQKPQTEEKTEPKPEGTPKSSAVVKTS